MSSAASIELRGVRRVYGGVAAVDGVSLNIRSGERVALVGPSGAGKTSLLRLIAGMFEPDEGEVLVEGQVVGRLGRRERSGLVGMIQQRHDLVETLRVRHNIQAGILGQWGFWRSVAALVLPVESPVAAQAAARLGIDHKLDQRTASLSGGEQQRVAIARLLVQDPGVLLADEPVASLDPARADDLLALLARLAVDDQRTLVVSIHQPELARRYFDRIVGLRDGQVAFDRPAVGIVDDDLDELYLLGER